MLSSLCHKITINPKIAYFWIYSVTTLMSLTQVATKGKDLRARRCYGPQPYARFASICQSIRVCVSAIPVLFEPATFVYLFS
jgi:hypothetical protein